MVPEILRIHSMALRRHTGALLLLAACVLALPTEVINRTTANSSPAVSPATSSQEGETNIRKQTLTYILGQPSQSGAVQSPAELLSPDRYEFYTFDDDGQIIKKLMSVEEIQRIIANSKKADSSADTDTLGDYYQVLTVTPDIESHPAVRVNPHEPLFSIHDVITSVQNVLKGEIGSKLTNPPPSVEAVKYTQGNNASQNATSPNNDQKNADLVEVFGNTSKVNMNTDTVKRPAVEAIETSTTSSKTTMEVTATTSKTTKIGSTTMPGEVTRITSFTPPKITPTSTPGVKNGTVTSTTSKTIVNVTKKQTATSTSKKPTNVTKKPNTEVPKKPQPSQVKPQQSTTTLKASSTLKATIAPSPTTRPTSTATNTPSGVSTKVEVKVTSSVSHSSSSASQISSATTPRAATTSTTSAPTTSTTAGPTALSTEKAAITEPKNNEINPSSTEKIALSEERTVLSSAPLSLADAHPAYTSNDTYLNIPIIPETVFTIENLLFDNVATKNVTATAPNNFTAAESALSEVQFPINQDLAESVSSVLSQIANEISVSSQLKLDDSIPTTTLVYTTDVSETTEPISTTTEEFFTTIGPLDSSKTHERLEDSTETTTQYDILNEPTTLPTYTFKPQNEPKPFSKGDLQEEPQTTESENLISTIAPVESRTESNDELLTTTLATDKDDEPETTTVRELVLTSTRTTTSAQPEKKIEASNRVEVIENVNANSSIEIIQEAETGRIPRPTQSPDEISTRPGSTEGVAINASTYENVIEAFSPTTLSTTTVLPNAELVEAITDNSLPESSSSESNPDDSVESISVEFVPMVIRTSTTPKTVSTTSTTSTTKETIIETNKTSENLKRPQVEETIESKIEPDEGSVLNPSEKIIIGTLNDDKATLISTTLPKETLNASPGLKQNHAKPQNNVKPHKPVFIKPTKTKPQQVEAKPSKPTRPLSFEEDQRPYETPLLSSPSALELDQAPAENLGLEATTVHLDGDVRDFVDLCNELAFSLWSSITHNGLSFVRSVVVSPFAVTSLLAMVFLGARGPTSGQMNDILKLDDVVTFNPHLVFRNVTESLVIARNPGVATAAFVRELYSDRSKGKLLDFYKERAQQFYDGHVEEINFKAIGETLRRQTNHLVKRQTWGKVKDFLQGSTLMLRPPLAAFSANIFQADCSRASVKDRDGEMYFVVLPSSRLRRLVPVPAAVWRDDFLAGYEPNLDATVAAVGAPGGIVSTIFVMPGQQGLIAPGDSLARLEHHLLGSSFKRGHWSRLMRSLLRRPGLELQVPRLSHKSVVNTTASLQKMGLRDLFSAEKADLTGLNGLANDLHLSDMVQVNMFSTCGDDNTAHHTEFYPATPLQRREKSADNVFAESIESLFAVSDFEDPSISALPLELRPRQARIPSGRIEGRSPDPPRLRLDRPFLFFVRHNPTGIILHIGRFNPRLMH